MTTKTIQLDIVSAVAPIFSGPVQHLIVTGKAGELGIFPGHTALLTALKPGQITAKLANGDEEVFYISGGMLEVQPELVTVLADSALRAHDIDEAAALAAKERAEKILGDQKESIQYAGAATELAEAAAQLRALQSIRKLANRS
ncbi:MAG TPA: F0F1 ATP synthase subunit epsilon [Coxiellaceae bacterium]|nr:F0F1 ATP synthase subunit epsilon [Coxiellaceae bacterium]